MMSKIKSALRRPPSAESAETPTVANRLADAIAVHEPVAIDLSDAGNERPERAASPGDSSIYLTIEPDTTDMAEEKRLSAKKAKQELLTELQKNYKEVLDLVRRVQAHLDVQEERSTRLMEIVERVPSALEQLPEHRAQNERLIGVVEKLSEVSRSSHTLSQQSVRELAKANEQLKLSAQSDHDLVESMEQFRGTVDGMAEHHSRSAGAVERLANRVDQRDQELSEAIENGRKWLVVAVSVCAGSAAVALILAIVALVG